MMKKDSIVLIGMAGVGKSTTGPALAAATGFTFIDLDVYIREKEGCTIQSIIDSRGDEALLALEERCMLELDLRQKVVAPGGSIIYLPSLMQYLKQVAVLIYLEDSLENLEKRLTNAASRGIVGLKQKSLRQIFNERSPLYASFADFTITITGKSTPQIVNEITGRLVKQA
jgi:shikimate kinase